MTEPDTARKVVVPRAGSYDKLTFRDLPIPLVGPSDVLIEVRSIGVNYADVIVRMGLYSSAREYVGWPITPGFEVAGVVLRTGEKVTGVSPGDPVFAITRFGGYTSHLVVDQRYVFAKPDHLDFDEAAAIPAVFMTAWFALFELAHPRAGASVLVHSAAGGVGGSLVQMAKIAETRVIGVVGRTAKVDSALAFGCDHVIDKSTESIWPAAERLAPAGYDVVCDANGVATLKQSYQHLRRTGKLVVYGFHTMMPKTGGRPNWVKLAADYARTPRFNPLDMTRDSRSVMAFNLSYLFDRNDLMEPAFADILRWLADGSLKPPPVTRYPLAEVAHAHRDIESGSTVGKLVLVP